MKTTLNEIKAHNPCTSGWSKLLKSLGKTKADDEPLDLMRILKSNGLDDAIWTLRCFDYLDYCLFLADIAESVLDIYEKNSDNPAPRNAILAIRDYKAGGITKEGLKAAYADAYAAADASAADAFIAADAAYAAAYAAYAAYADAAYTAAYADDAYTAAYTADARKQKREETKSLFIKHFGGKK